MSDKAEELAKIKKALDAAARDGNEDAARELAKQYRDISTSDPDALMRAMNRYPAIMGSVRDRERMTVQPEQRAKEPGGPDAIAPGFVRGATAMTGLPGDLGDVVASVPFANAGLLNMLPGSDEQRQFLASQGIDTTTGIDTQMGNAAEFAGGGAVGGIPNFIRQAAASGVKGLAGSVARNVGASEAAFVGSEAGAEFAEGAGLPPAAGQIPGAIAPGMMVRGVNRAVTGASQKTRSANSRAARDAVKDADEIATEITAGTATPNSKAKFFERLLTAIPGGMRVMHVFALKANKSMVTNLRRATEQTGRETAGIGIHSGINEGIQRFQRKSNAWFNRAARAIPDGHPVTVKNLKTTLNEMKVELPKSMDEVAEAIGRDTGLDADAVLAAVAKVDRGVGVLTFKEADALRRLIGRQVNNSSIITDAGRHTDLKRLYGAITEDIGADLNRTQRYLWDGARNHWKEGRDNIDNFLQPVVGKPGNLKFERMFDAAFNDNARSVGRVRAVYAELNPAQRDTATKAFIYRLGRTGDEAGGVTLDFNMKTFLNRWKDIPEKAKEILFQDSPDLRKNMDAFVRHIDRVLETNAALANPSQSGPVGLAAATAFLTLAGLSGAALNPTDQAEGAVVGAAAGVGGLAVAAAAASSSARLMTWKPFVQWLARGTRVPNNKTAEHFGQLVAMARDDPYMSEAVMDFLDVLQADTDQRNLINDGLVGPRVELAGNQ